MIYEKIASRRTIRRYNQKKIPQQVLIKCVDAARLSPSVGNRQPLRYVVVNDNKLLKPVFSTLRWAGHLPSFKHSAEETPTAYVVILSDRNISQNPGHEAGIAAMSISMVAYDNGLGSCILGAIDRERLREVLNVPDDLDIVLVVSLGYPSETPVVDKLRDDETKYWLDESGVLHVPKRSFEDIVVWNGYH